MAQAPPKALAESPTNLPFSMPDVNVVAVGDTAYAFCGTDEVPVGNGTEKWLMPYWRCFSSQDLVHWDFESLLDPAATYVGPSQLCFVGHGIERKGRWYWYFSDYDKSIGVAVADTPKGPWKDALGKPLVPSGLVDTRPYDPCAFIDDDGRAYLVFGANKNKQINYHIAELNPDMISLKNVLVEDCVSLDPIKGAFVELRHGGSVVIKDVLIRNCRLEHGELFDLIVRDASWWGNGGGSVKELTLENIQISVPAKEISKIIQG